MQQQVEYETARARAEAKYGFIVHAAVYLVVMTTLVIIDLLTSPGHIWFVWPLAGWGLAVVLHGAGVFLVGERHSMIDALTEREMRRTGAGGNDRPV